MNRMLVIHDQQDGSNNPVCNTVSLTV